LPPGRWRAHPVLRREKRPTVCSADPVTPPLTERKRLLHPATEEVLATPRGLEPLTY
jgi:hypothetical protein